MRRIGGFLLRNAGILAPLAVAECWEPLTGARLTLRIGFVLAGLYLAAYAAWNVEACLTAYRDAFEGGLSASERPEICGPPEG